MYKMLGTGEWQIANNCPLLIEAIPSRMHDEKKPGDVLKVPGDSLDDVADDVRYGIYTWITANEMPREVKRENWGDSLRLFFMTRRYQKLSAGLLLLRR